MIQYFKVSVAAAAPSAAMDAVNHSKNRAMEADSISKHRCCTTSHKGRGNFLRIAFFVLLLVVVLPTNYVQAQITFGARAGLEKQSAISDQQKSRRIWSILGGGGLLLLLAIIDM